MLHLPTAYLTVGLMYLLMPTVAQVVLSGLRSRSTRLWCAGSVLCGLGLVLLGLHVYMPQWVAYPLANGLVVLAHLVWVQALRHELLRPLWPWPWLLGLGVGFMLGDEYLLLGLESPVAHFFWASCVLAMVCFHIGQLCYLLPPPRGSRSIHWVTGVYWMTGTALVLHAVAIGVGFFGLGGEHSLLSVGVGWMGLVVGSIGLIGILVERTKGKDLAAAIEKAKQEEAARLGAQIAQLDRQRCLGQMSASLGHELKQPLTTILLDAQMGQHGLAQNRLDAAQLQQLLEHIEANTHRATQLIERIGRFIRPLPVQHQRVELCQLVHDVAQLLAYEARNAQAVFVLPTVPVWVQGDDIQLSQIVLNIYRNAIQAMQDTPPPRQITVTLAQPIGWVLLRVRDTGPGLTPDTLVQICQPFFTTKPDGLGLGLCISQAIAQHHGGTLHIVNHPQGGAQAELALPALD